MNDTTPADQPPADRTPADRNHTDTTHSDPTSADPTGDPTAPMTAADPAAAPAGDTGDVPAGAPKVVQVQRRFLIAGSAVGALAVVGLSFGAGYLVGHGDHDDDRDGGPRHRGSWQMMIDEQQRAPGMQQGPGRGRLPRLDQMPDETQQPEAPTTTPSSIPG